MVNSNGKGSGHNLGAEDAYKFHGDTLSLLSLLATGKNAEVTTSAAAVSPASDVESSLLEGRVIKGKYKIMRLLGRGGTSRVFLCQRHQIGDEVALKMLWPTLAADSLALRRFYSEAATTASLKHPNVLTIHDFDHTEEGIPFIVTELLSGHTYQEELEQTVRVSARRALQIIMPICSVLNIAHSKGIVHRDLKPANIILHRMHDRTEVVKLIDFGSAKQVIGQETMAANNAITEPGLTFGTPDYMSPEQCAGSALDGRSDIYTLGIMLFRMLTGQLPFESTTIPRLMLHHMHSTPPSPRDLCAEISPQIEGVILRAISKAPDLRYKTVGEFSDALLLAVTGRIDRRSVK